MPTPKDVLQRYRKKHEGKYALGGITFWLVYTWALLAILPGSQGTVGTVLVAVLTFFLAALTVDYPIRLQAGRELGYVGLPWRFDRWKHVEREWVASVDTCYRCGESGVPGVASRAVIDEIQWGLPGRRIESETNHDCRSCAEYLGHLPDDPEPDWSGEGGSAEAGGPDDETTTQDAESRGREETATPEDGG